MGGGAPCRGETLPCVWGEVHQETGREGAGSGTGGVWARPAGLAREGGRPVEVEAGPSARRGAEGEELREV